MTKNTTSSVFEALGFQVLSLELGVYVLQPRDDASEDRVVGLMLAHAMPESEMLQVSLFLEPVPADVAAVDIVEVWQSLNAQRFEETGLMPRSLELGPVPLSDILREAYPRPEGGSRLALRMPTGDVVCLN